MNLAWEKEPNQPCGGSPGECWLQFLALPQPSSWLFGKRLNSSVPHGPKLGYGCQQSFLLSVPIKSLAHSAAESQHVQYAVLSGNVWAQCEGCWEAVKGSFSPGLGGKKVQARRTEQCHVPCCSESSWWMLPLIKHRAAKATAALLGFSGIRWFWSHGASLPEACSIQSVLQTCLFVCRSRFLIKREFLYSSRRGNSRPLENPDRNSITHNPWGK